MKSNYFVKKIRRLVFCKYLVLTIFLNIANSYGHPRAVDDTSSSLHTTQQKYISSTTPRYIINKTEWINDRNQNNEVTDQLESGNNTTLTNPDDRNINELTENYETSFGDESFSSLDTCILGTAQIYLDWWVNEDGSLVEKLAEHNAFAGDALDLSLKERTENSLLEHVLRLRNEERIDNVVFMSVAYNGLYSIPRTTLLLVESTLQYLSMSGNPFSSVSFSNAPSIVNDIFVGWATFPELLKLVELDLRNCSIQFLDEKTFENVPNLKKLYLSHNNFVSIPSGIFGHMKWLAHLDLSYQNAITTTPNSYVPRDPYVTITEGLMLPEDLFYRLDNLLFLDLSHTKLLASSVKAFTMLGAKLQQLSLCYTSLPIIGRKMFSTTSLKVLDISGNPGLTPLIRRDSFEGLENKLEILAYSHSNLKHLDFIQELSSLRLLQLNDNNINQLSNETFRKLEKLEIIDFSSNHIGNWYSQAFQHNSNLRVLNLRDNNINLLTADMMADFSIVDYLAIGNNNFICNCVLREFIELAAKNTRLANCTKAEETTTDPPAATQNPIPLAVDVRPIVYVFPVPHNYDIVTRMLHHYQESVTISNQNIKESSNKYGMYWNLILYNKNSQQQKKSGFFHHDSIVYCNDTHYSREHLLSTSNNSAEIRLNFTFRLLDYSENDYTCIDSENSTEHHFAELDYCILDRMTMPNFIERFQTNNIGLGTLLLVMAAFAFILLVYYHKWWDIRYIFLLVKNATILSRLNKETEKMKIDSKAEVLGSETYSYDVFVSYSESNRQWILTEFLPNIENESSINVCLHERDFQVGLSILENIISCMDRSRCILLVISESFIISHWCQFEMHLAQHRLLETKREQMILVLLENIPKGKRPKTLEYLMKTKTYIVWPTKKNPSVKIKKASKTVHSHEEPTFHSDNKGKQDPRNTLEEERKLFWRRLKKAMINANWESDKLSF